MIDIEQRRKVQELIQKGRYDSAEKVLNHMMNQDPDEPSTHNTLGDVLAKLGEQERALEHFGTAAELYCDNGLHSAALSVARKALRMDEGFTKAHYIKARSFDMQDKPEKARGEYLEYLRSKPPVRDRAVLRSCEAMTRLDPENDKWVLRLAKLAAGRDDDTALARAVELADERGLKQHGRLRRALEKLRKKLGNSEEPASTVSQVDFEESDFVEAQEEPEETGELAGPGRKRIGEYFVAEGLLEASDVLRALEIQGGNDEPRKLGDILVDLGLVSSRQVREALGRQIEDMRQELERSKGDGLGYVELGNLLLEVGDFYGAVDAYLNACTIYRANRRESMVFELLEGVLDICPESLSAAKELVRIREAMDVEGQARSFYRLAVAYLLNDSPHEALASLEASAAIDPHFQMTRTLMNGIRPSLADSEDYADIALILADIDEKFDRESAHSLAGIIRDFQDGIEQAVSQDDYNTHYDLGIAYMEMGLNREALKEFEQVLGSPEHRRKAREMLGRCCLRLERYDEAEDHFRKGLSLSASEPEVAVGFHLALSGVYRATGRETNAARELDAASRLDPDIVRMRDRLE